MSRPRFPGAEGGMSGRGSSVKPPTDAFRRKVDAEVRRLLPGSQRGVGGGPPLLRVRHQLDQVTPERLDVEGPEPLAVVECLTHRIREAECWWSTRRSSWFGHQSWFVLGRPAAGVGLGIAGFSLSLMLSVTSASSVAAGISRSRSGVTKRRAADAPIVVRRRPEMRRWRKRTHWHEVALLPTAQAGRPS